MEPGLWAMELNRESLFPGFRLFFDGDMSSGNNVQGSFDEQPPVPGFLHAGCPGRDANVFFHPLSINIHFDTRPALLVFPADADLVQ